MAEKARISSFQLILAISLSIFLGVLVGGGLIYQKAKSILNMQSVVEQDSTVILNKIKEVAKLITVEGQFANILDHKDYIGYDYFPFQKKALLKVKAKVSVGYDLEKLKFDFDHSTKVIHIRNIPQPEILAIDPDISYYDLTEGYFNSFTPEELTKLNQQAKQMVRDNALKSELMEKAQEQGIETFKLIEFIAGIENWKVEFHLDDSGLDHAEVGLPPLTN